MSLEQSTILITGGTGLIGSALTHRFLSLGCKVIILTRNLKKLEDEYPTHNVQGIKQLDHLSNAVAVDYVINLAGETIGGKKWSDERKKKIIESRLNTTHNLVKWLKTRSDLPKKVISGSAVGYYGINEQYTWKLLDEDSPSQSIFVSEVCQKWEDAIKPVQDLGIALNIIRLGVVFSKHAPALQQMLLPIKLNTVGKIASGQQPLTWVHIHDVVNAINFLLEKQTHQTVYNLTAPDKTRQLDFVHTASQILGKTAIVPLPEFALKLALGEQAQLVTNGQFVKPKHLLEEGYTFKYPTLEQALKNIL